MYTSTYTELKTFFQKHSPALSPPPKLQHGSKNRRNQDRRLGMHLKNIDNVKWCQNDKHPIVAEIQLTVLVTFDEIFSDWLDANQVPGYSKTDPPPVAEDSELKTIDSNCPLQEGDRWSDHDVPHSCMDIYSFDHPRTLEKYITPINQLYASIFPGCRHFDCFPSREEVMYHIVEEHITPTQKQFVCINCGAEFDRAEEANEHQRSNMQNVDQ